MSEEKQPQPPKPNPDGTQTQEVRHSQVSARVPESIGRGVFSTGAIVLQGPQEFIIDFMVRLAHPHQVVSRVVLTPLIMQRYLLALQENLNKYQQKFGPPPTMPATAPPQSVPTIEEIYDQMKLPEELQSGIYSNAVMISHTPAEFCFDFITNFFPRSSVASRIYMSATQVPRLLDSLNRAFQQYQVQSQKQQQKLETNPNPPTGDQPENEPPTAQ